MAQTNPPTNFGNNQQKPQVKKKISWRGGCGLIAIFIILYSLTIFGLMVWSSYQNIIDNNSAAISLDNIQTVDRQLVESKDDPSWGSDDAKIVIVEFSDFECPFCKQVFPILHEINFKYSGQLKFIYRDFLGHDSSQKLAEAAQCADEQGKFLVYHDKLFINQGNLSVDSLKSYARQVGIGDVNKFDQCLDSGKFELEVQQDYQEAVELGVEGTPTFFINGIKVPGARPKEEHSSLARSPSSFDTKSSGSVTSGAAPPSASTIAW